MSRVILRAGSLSIDCYNFIKMCIREELVKKATRHKDAEYRYCITFVYQTATDVDNGTLDYHNVWYDSCDSLLKDFEDLQNQIDAQLGRPTEVEHGASKED